MSPTAALHKLPAEVPPPKINGRLNDPAWEHATLLGPLTQQSPHEGAEPSQRTDVRVTYDDHFLYVAVRAWDTQPDQLIRKVMRRDTTQRTDDRILLLIDPFLDRRNGYMFSTNPNSARYEALIENNAGFRTEWDGIWYARARVDDKGWTCEFAFPFQTLSFDPAQTSWGFNVVRSVRRLNEEDRWASWRLSKPPLDLSEAGTLTGIANIDQGIGLDVVPSGAIGGFREREVDATTGGVSHRYYSTLDPSFDAFYKITPSITGAVTANTDFSDADVDARQVNLDRFALFFPETRDFFLQDAGIFDFAGLGESFGPTAADVWNPNGMPFFTRKLGIAPGGEIVDIRGGAKVTGRVGRLNFGVLDVQMEDPGGIGHKNLSVGRAKWNVGAESLIGVIATHGDPDSPSSSSTFGTDFRLRTSQFRDGQIVELIGLAEHTHTPGVSGDEEAYGLRLRYPNDLWYGQLAWTRIGEHFDPALGFVNRSAIDEYFFEGRRRWRPEGGGLVRYFETWLESTLVQGTDGHLETLIIEPTLIEVHDQLDDYFYIGGQSRSEILDAPFEIAPGVVIPAGRYDWGRAQVGIGMAQSRPVALFVDYSVGGFFGGHLYSLEANLELRTSRHFFGQLQWIQNEADLPFGNFTQRLIRVRLQFVFTPDLGWDTFLQYDNLTDTIGWNSRVRWILRPGEEIALVWNQGADVTGHDFRGTHTGLTGKLSWTFRF